MQYDVSITGSKRRLGKHMCMHVQYQLLAYVREEQNKLKKYKNLRTPPTPPKKFLYNALVRPCFVLNVGG